MSDATTHLLLPYILAAQAQKHVTHNEALRILDGLVQLSVLDRGLTAPPPSPADGDRYIVASGASGVWAGWDLNVALWTDGAWLRLPPRSGWRAWVEDEGLLLVYDGADWVGTTPAALQNMALLGLGTTADTSNPFSAKLNAALWTAKTLAEGGTGDLFYTMNKEAAGDDLGLTLQTGFVTKALVGLFGSDRFRLAVSADGSTFFDGLSVDNANGIVDQPRLPRFKAYTNYDNYVGIGTWMRIPRKMGIDSTRSWARIPRYRGRPFHASGGLADWVMESVLAGRVKRFGCGSPLPQAFSGECQAVSVMNEAVEDRVGECRVADGFVPVLDRQLAGDDRRAAPVAVLEDLEQVAPFG